MEGSDRSGAVVLLRAFGDRLRRVGWVRGFLVVGILGGLYFSLTTEPLAGVDEISHVARLDSISGGTLVAPPSDEDPPDYQIDPDLCRRIYRAGPTQAMCGPTAPARMGSYYLIIASEGYPPTSYAPALPGYVVGKAVGDIDLAIRGARLTQLAFYLAVVAVALRLTPRGHAAIFAIGLVPAALQNAATVSADPVTLAMALLAAALALRAGLHGAAGRRAPTRLLALLAASLVVISAGKPGYGALALLALLPPTAAFGSWSRRLGFGAATVGACAVVSLGWYVVSLSELDAPARPSTDPAAQAEWVMEHPGAFVRAIARTWTDADELAMIVSGALAPVSRLKPPIPLAVTVGGAAMLVGAGLEPRLRRRPAEPDGRTTSLPIDVVVAAALPAIAVVTFVLVNYAMYTGNSPVGAETIAGIQGRYFLPLLPLLLFVRARPHTTAPAPDLQLRWPLLLGAVLVWWASTVG